MNQIARAEGTLDWTEITLSTYLRISYCIAHEPTLFSASNPLWGVSRCIYTTYLRFLFSLPIRVHYTINSMISPISFDSIVPYLIRNLSTNGNGESYCISYVRGLTFGRVIHGTPCTLHQKWQEGSRTSIGVSIGAGGLCVDCLWQCVCVISQTPVLVL